ncbi:MAG: hypothetical protein A2284_18595 [Deltaproteobacteria bacterium RIFOXYA12_FULL_61_11]|nr:MAG: hypothetical protein A2284_18595 [Deltaproteobacteria bacterium RIFOXYA12_FULL_61_11]
MRRCLLVLVPLLFAATGQAMEAPTYLCSGLGGHYHMALTERAEALDAYIFAVNGPVHLPIADGSCALADKVYTCALNLIGTETPYAATGFADPVETGVTTFPVELTLLYNNPDGRKLALTCVAVE